MRGDDSCGSAGKGVGFDLEVKEQQRGGGFGLFSLRERAEIMGGEVRIHSAPGQGTMVDIEMPRVVQAR